MYQPCLLLPRNTSCVRVWKWGGGVSPYTSSNLLQGLYCRLALIDIAASGEYSLLASGHLSEKGPFSFSIWKMLSPWLDCQGASVCCVPLVHAQLVLGDKIDMQLSCISKSCKVSSGGGGEQSMWFMLTSGCAQNGCVPILGSKNGYTYKTRRPVWKLGPVYGVCNSNPSLPFISHFSPLSPAGLSLTEQAYRI